jgi:ABC-type transporter Mla subunit MlaD
MADMTQTVDLDSTIAALQSGITSLPPEAAIGAIESWQQQLQGTEIAETLGELKLALEGGGKSGAAIGEIIADLGSQTASAASTASGDAASKLEQLGQLLSQAGSSLM